MTLGRPQVSGRGQSPNPPDLDRRRPNVNRPGFSGGCYVSQAARLDSLAAIVRRLELGRRHVADRLEQPSVVEPVDPVERRELDGLAVPPRPPPPNHLGLEEADDRSRRARCRRSRRGCRPRARCRPRPAARCSESKGYCRRGRCDARGPRPCRHSGRRSPARARRARGRCAASAETRQPTMRRAKTSITKAT